MEKKGCLYEEQEKIFLELKKRHLYDNMPAEICVSILNDFKDAINAELSFFNQFIR